MDLDDEEADENSVENVVRRSSRKKQAVQSEESDMDEDDEDMDQVRCQLMFCERFLFVFGVCSHRSIICYWNPERC